MMMMINCLSFIVNSCLREWLCEKRAYLGRVGDGFKASMLGIDEKYMMIELVFSTGDTLQC